MPDPRPDEDVRDASKQAADSVLSEDEMREFQKRNIIAALKRSNWRVSGAGGAAEILGVKPTTLADRIRTYGIQKPNAA